MKSSPCSLKTRSNSTKNCASIWLKFALKMRSPTRTIPFPNHRKLTISNAKNCDELIFFFLEKRKFQKKLIIIITRQREVIIISTSKLMDVLPNSMLLSLFNVFFDRIM